MILVLVITVIIILAGDHLARTRIFLILLQNNGKNGGFEVRKIDLIPSCVILGNLFNLPGPIFYCLYKRNKISSIYCRVWTCFIKVLGTRQMGAIFTPFLSVWLRDLEWHPQMTLLRFSSILSYKSLKKSDTLTRAVL